MKTILTICLNLLLSLLIVFGCSDNFTDNPKANQAPKTFVSIFSNRNLSPTTSKITINWWGDDPDGLVVGFIYTFDPTAPDVQTWSNDSPDPKWVFTTKTEETFTLTLAGNDTLYTFWVKAVDDADAADSPGAIQDFSIVNSRPIVEFPVATDVPETTFTVATFVWSSSDLDGDDTIAKFQYALDDTSSISNWLDIEPNVKSLTLTASDGLTEGEHVFFLRAIDLAGATSDIIRMPRQEDDVWYVREPSSSFLIVDDYNIADNTGSFYQTTLQAIVGPVDTWDIKSNSNALEPASPIAFTKTLQLFDRIFWYSDSNPNLEKAQVSLPDFLDGGGKIIMSSTFPEFATNQGDPLDFSPVDSLGTKINRLLRNQLVRPTNRYASQGFPDLQVNTAIIPFIFPVAPKISSDTLYVLPENPGVWPGTPPMAVINGSSTFVFFGLPISRLDGQGTVSQLFEKILNEIF
ncbi:MAG: hypothetical protein ACE5G1_01405 [bacterium]